MLSVYLFQVWFTHTPVVQHGLGHTGGCEAPSRQLSPLTGGLLKTVRVLCDRLWLKTPKWFWEVLSEKARLSEAPKEYVNKRAP